MPPKDDSDKPERSEKKTKKKKVIIGWREWCALPTLGIPAIKAKIDTGARTSALHAFNIRTTPADQHERVHFSIHPIQGNKNVVVHCHAPIIDERYIMSSNGHKELRCVISTLIMLGDVAWEIELTLSDRDPLRFRMLLGRKALKKNFMINPSRSHCSGKITKAELHYLYLEQPHR